MSTARGQASFADIARAQLALRQRGLTAGAIPKLTFREWATRYHPKFIWYRHLQVFDRVITRMLAGEYQMVMSFWPPRHGKLTAHNTPVFTPTGWTTHGELKPGDFVFHPSGLPTRVMAVGPEALANVAMRIDGETILCHEHHEWSVFDRSYNAYRTYEAGHFLRLTKFGKPMTVWKPERKPRAKYMMPPVAALQFLDVALPLDPYVLGAWLGDGSTGKPNITHAASDVAVVNEIERRGFAISARWVHAATGVVTTSFGGKVNHAGPLTLGLLAAGVRDRKHIPSAYLLASIEQKLDLLAGLVDTDGHVEKRTGRVRIVTGSAQLAADIRDVAMTLGWEPYITEQAPVLSSSGIQGTQTIYTVGFQPDRALPTVLNRKRITRFAPRRKRGLEGVERVARGELGRCIQVEAPDGMYLVGRTLIPTHNSECVSRMLPAYCLYRWPTQTYAITSYGADLATKLSRAARNNFIGALDPDHQTASDWNTLQGGGLWSCGVGGSATGSGYFGGGIDDPVKDAEESLSETIRARNEDWLDSVWLFRREPGAWNMFTMTRWHHADLAGYYLSGWAKEIKTHVCHFPAIAEDPDEVRALYPDYVTVEPEFRKIGEALCPERTNLEQLLAIQRGTTPYWWSCTPGETPILMADWTTKRIDEVRVGDEVLGFEKGVPSARAKLVRSTVLKTFSKIGEVMTLDMESGRSVRCTADHRWYTARGPERGSYAVPAVGRRLMYVCPTEDVCSDEERELWWYLAGIIDGEGSIGKGTAGGTCVISQSPTANPETFAAIQNTLDRLGISYNLKIGPAYKSRGKSGAFVLHDVGEVYRKLLRFTRGTGKRAQIIERMLARGHMFIKERDRVEAIHSPRTEPVYALTTTSGNYVAWGYASSNSLYQQRPSVRGGSRFPRDKVKIIDALPSDAPAVKIRYWDKAGTLGGGAHTAGVLMWLYRNGRVIIADVQRRQLDSLAREQLMLNTAKLDGRETYIRVETEPGSGGKESTEGTIRSLKGFRVEGDRPTGSKEIRSDLISAQWQGGNVEVLQASWTKDYLDEAEVFPTGKFKDQMDATSGAYNLGVELMGARRLVAPVAGARYPIFAETGAATD